MQTICSVIVQLQQCHAGVIGQLRLEVTEGEFEIDDGDFVLTPLGEARCDQIAGNAVHQGIATRGYYDATFLDPQSGRTLGSIILLH